MTKRNTGLDAIVSLTWQMERPLVAIERYGNMLCFFAEHLEETEGLALQQVVNAMQAEAELITKLRTYILDGLRNCGGKVTVPIRGE